MANDIFTTTITKLSKYAEQNESIVVGFSTGKDSLVVLDMCCKLFKRVVPYFMYFVPNISFEDEVVKWAEDRYKIEVFCEPHRKLFMNLRDGIFCDPVPELKGLKDIGPYDIPYEMMDRFGIELHANGYKKADFFTRAAIVNQNLGMLSPIAAWKDFEVMAYLKLHAIPLPESLGENTNATRLTTEVILWLHDHHHDDYLLVKAIFPYIDAVVKRREFYGFTGNYNKLMQQKSFNSRGER